MKTPMQEFWNKIALKLSVEQVNEFLPEFDIALEKEKEQIADAFRNGSTSSMLGGGHWTQYYNQTYNQNK